MIDITIIGNLVLLLPILFLSVYSAVKSYFYHRFSLLNYMELWFSLLFVLIPCEISILGSDVLHPFFYRVLYASPSAIFLCNLVIWTSFLFIRIGYRRKTHYSLRVQVSSKELDRLFLVLFFIGLAALPLMLSRYGGISYVINNVSGIRSGQADTKDYLGSFIGMFSSYLFYAFTYFYCRYMFCKKKSLLLLASLCFLALLVRSLLLGGRASMITPFLVFLFIPLIQGDKVSLPSLILVTGVVIAIIVLGKTYLFNMFSSEFNLSFSEVYNMQKENGLFASVFKEFEHQYCSLLMFIDSDFPYRYGTDYFLWLFKPLKLLKVNETWVDSISYYNTYMLLGDWDSTIPPGFLGLAYINLGIVGIVVQSYVWGRVIRILDDIFTRKIKSSSTNLALIFTLYIVMFDLMWYALQNGDPAIIVQSNLPLIVLFAYFLLSKKIFLHRG